MNKELEINLDKFKITTTNIINALYTEKYDDLKLLFDARQMIIDEINELKYDKNEFIFISDKLKIRELNKELNRVFILKKDHLKNEMIKLNERKNVNNNYRNRYGSKAFFFSKEV